MRPVNLIPADERRGASRGASTSSGISAYILVGVLAFAVIGALLLTTKSNAIKAQESKLADLTAEEAALQQKEQPVSTYATLQQTAQARFDAVYDTARGRFNFERRLRQLTRVLPNTTILTKLDASLTGDGGAAGAPAPAAGEAGAAAAPTFKLTACTTAGKPGVALATTRMRNLDGVTKVTVGKVTTGTSCELGSSSSASSASATAGQAQAGSASTTALAATRTRNHNTYDLTVVFAAPGGGAAAVPAPEGSTATATQQANRAAGTAEAANQAAGADQPTGATP